MTDATMIATTARDHLEADIRKRMACVTKARGWDTARRRAEEMAEIDDLLDSWNATT